MKRIKIALVGDFDEKMHTHRALNESIEHCKPQLAFHLDTEWVATELSDKIISARPTYSGIWIAPGSPYKNESGVFQVIQHARERNIPVYGSCGGFQYMILEYAKNVLRMDEAGHEESDSKRYPVISKLRCSLKGEEERVVIPDKQSWLYEVLNTSTITAKYYCSYGINPLFQEILGEFPLVFTGFSPTGEVRAFELKGHRFFKGTLFQPSLSSSPERPNPLIVSFFAACV
jgi:CTP synthase (UTP-ammonia lyase)